MIFGYNCRKTKLVDLLVILVNHAPPTPLWPNDWLFAELLQIAVAVSGPNS